MIRGQLRCRSPQHPPSLCLHHQHQPKVWYQGYLHAIQYIGISVLWLCQADTQYLPDAIVQCYMPLVCCCLECKCIINSAQNPFPCPPLRELPTPCPTLPSHSPSPSPGSLCRLHSWRAADLVAKCSNSLKLFQLSPFCSAWYVTAVCTDIQLHTCSVLSGNQLLVHCKICMLTNDLAMHCRRQCCILLSTAVAHDQS